MKNNIFKILDLKSVKFKHRKIVHYALLSSIVLLQVCLLLILYNEIVNESKLENIQDRLLKSDQARALVDASRDDYLQIQKSLQNFIFTKDDQFLDNYYSSMKGLKSNFDSIKSFSKQDTNFNSYVNAADSVSFPVAKLDRIIDSLIDMRIIPNAALESDLLKLKKFDYQDILNSVHMESFMMVDSVERKGLFTRLGNAISGKVDVQKEKVNVVVTMKYGKKVTTGNIEEQLANAFKNTNNYYQNQFSNLKSTLKNNSNKDLDFLSKNNELSEYSNLLLNKYDDALRLYKDATQEEFKKQYKTNKIIRNAVIIGLVLFLIIISGILSLFTRLAFDYEKMLENAQEKIQQNLAFKNRIVGMISHEIRAPLNIISIFSDSISKRIKEEDLKESFKTIQHTTTSLSILSNQILEYSKNENKKLEINKSSFNLKQEMTSFLKSNKALVEQSSNKMEIDLNIPNDCEVSSDKAKVHQILYNVVGNANKFTENGLIQIKLNIEDYSKTQYNFFVAITDSGKGMSENDLKNVFESYYQGVVSDKVHNLGAGLGLNLCKELVELFDGEIAVFSQINKGTKVAFNLILDKTN